MNSPASAEDRKNPPVLHLGELRLRPLRPGDEHALLAYLSDPAVREHTSIPVPTLEALTAAVQRDIAAYADRSSFRFALAQSDDRLIGLCGFNSWSAAHGHAELAYELSPQYWGRGYMRRAVLALLRWGFSELGLNRIHAFVMTSNARSIKLLERCGFVQEGTLRQFRIARGEPRDFHVYSVLAHDFASTDYGASPAPIVPAMTPPSQPEVWMRGPVPDIPPLLQPAAHALLQCLEEVRAVVSLLSTEHLWARPGGAASVGFHVRHATGSLDRLLTYARGEGLSEEQRAYLAAEGEPGSPPAPAAGLVAAFEQQVDRALAQLRHTDESTVLEPRGVGRLQLPSTVLGLLFHAAEHTQRHAGQIATTAKIVQRLAAGSAVT